MKVADVANGIIETASTSDLKNLQTLKTVCNSDSAFVAAVKKYQAYQKAASKGILTEPNLAKTGPSSHLEDNCQSTPGCAQGTDFRIQTCE